LLLPAARAADAAPPSPDRPEAALADRPAAAPVAPLARPAWALAAGAPPCRRLRRSIIWSQAEPRLVGGDFIHPMPAGAKIVGNLLYQALFDGYNQFKVRRMQEKFTKVTIDPLPK